MAEDQRDDASSFLPDGPSLLDTVERLDPAKTRLIVAPIASPSLHVQEARQKLAEFESKNADRLTPQVVQFLSIYLTNGYDEIAAAKAVGAPKIDSHPNRRRRWAEGILKETWAQEALRLRHNADYSARRLTRERLIEELELVATANMADYVARDWAGNPQVSFDMEDKRRMAAVAKLRTKASSEGSEREGTKRELLEVTFELHDKQKAIHKLLDLYDKDDRIVDSAATMQFANAVMSDSRPILFQLVPVPAGRFVPAPAEHAPPVSETEPKTGDRP